jgi:hypothetical protein
MSRDSKEKVVSLRLTFQQYQDLTVIAQALFSARATREPTVSSVLRYTLGVLLQHYEEVVARPATGNTGGNVAAQ